MLRPHASASPTILTSVTSATPVFFSTSPRHANFIVNLGGATAADIEHLVNHVQGEVLKKTGVALVTEVKIVGEGA